MSNRTSSLMLFAVVLVAGFLRFLHLDARSVWFDEAFSLELATNCGFFELLDRTGRDVHPPGYYLLLKAWMWLAPRSEYGIRSLSAILGVLGVGMLYLLTRRLTNLSHIPSVHRHSNSISISAAILLATNAQHIYWSREARMYTLGVVLTLLSTWLMLHWLRERSWRSGAGAACAVAALMLTHNYGLFTAACQAGCVVWHELCFVGPASFRNRVQRVVAGLSPWIAACWLYLPWYLVLLQQRARVSQEFWIDGFSWKTIPTAFYLHLFPLNDIGPVVDWVVLISAAVVLFAAGAVTLWLLIRGKWLRDTLAIPAILGLGPVCIAVVVSIVSVSVIETRHLSYSFPFLLILFCAAVYCLMPREGAVYTIIFVTGWSLFGELQHRASLQTDLRGGVRATVRALLPKISDSEMIVVQHPGIYHAVCFYLPNRERIKLYLPAGLPRHFYGRPLIRKTELISGPELNQLQQPRLIGVDTGGFGGDQGFPLPERWKLLHQHIQWFQDVAWYQGSIGAAEYVPATLPSVNADVNASLISNQNGIPASKAFRWDFSQFQFDREWFSLPEGAGESAKIRPTGAGLSFRPSAASSRENLYLSLRQTLLGDFSLTTVWSVPRLTRLHLSELNLRLLLTQNGSIFDVEPVDIRLRPNESVIELHCGRQSTSMSFESATSAESQLEIGLQRVGGKLSARVSLEDRACECETWISDQPMQLHLGDVVSLSKAESALESVQENRCFLKSLQTSADSIQYHGDDGVTDITIPPSMAFWKFWSVAGVFILSIFSYLRPRSDPHIISEEFNGDGFA